MGCQISSSVVVAPDKELNQYLSSNDIELVRKSWDFVAQDMIQFGMILFHKLMESEKEVKSLFKKMLTVLSNGEETINEEKLQRHALIVMQGLGAAVESLEDSAYLTNILIIMGARHKSYGIKPYMFEYLWQAIEYALQQTLGDEMDRGTHSAWQRVFGYLASKMTEGLLATESRDRKSPVSE